jgi:hypothetical protein
VNALVTKAIKNSGMALHLSREELEFNQMSLMDMDLSKTDKAVSQVVYEAIETKIRNVTSGLKLNV